MVTTHESSNTNNTPEVVSVQLDRNSSVESISFSPSLETLVFRDDATLFDDSTTLFTPNSSPEPLEPAYRRFFGDDEISFSDLDTEFNTQSELSSVDDLPNIFDFEDFVPDDEAVSFEHDDEEYIAQNNLNQILLRVEGVPLYAAMLFSSINAEAYDTQDFFTMTHVLQESFFVDDIILLETIPDPVLDVFHMMLMTLDPIHIQLVLCLFVESYFELDGIDYIYFKQAVQECIENQSHLPEPLVGIETNPGPQFFADESIDLMDDDYEEYVTPFFTDFISDVIQSYNESGQSPRFARDLFRNFFEGGIHFIGSRLQRDYEEILSFFGRELFDDVVVPIFASIILVPAPRLVGIEPNPGPCVLSTLRNSFQPQIQLPFSFGLDHDTQNLVETFVETLQHMSDKADPVKVEVASEQVKQIMDNLPSVQVLSEYTKQFVLLIAYVYCGYKGRDSKRFLMLQGVLGFYIGYTYGITSSLCKAAVATSIVIELVDPSEQVDVFHAQIGLTESIATPILAYVYFQTFNKNCSDGSISKFLKEVGDMPKQKEGLSHLIEFLLGITEKFANYLLEQAGLPTLSLRNNVFPEIEILHNKINDIIDSFRKGAPYNYDNAMMVFHLEKEVNNIIAKVPNTRDCAEYKRSALSLLTILKPIIGKMERNNIVGNGPRREPLGVLIAGATAVGKTTTITPLILATNALILPQHQLESFQGNHNDFIWNFIPENPFHDSYHGQFNTFIDEAGAYVDAAGTPDPGAMAVLRMINSANFPLHMAHLEDKGNVNFCSEIVWATSNRTFFEWKSMYCSEAYNRRFKIAMLHVPKVQYCKDGTVTENVWDRRLDLMKIPVCEDSFNLEVNEFFPYNFNNGHITGPSITTDELIELIVRSYEMNRDRSDDLLAFQAKIKQRYIDRRMKAQFSCDDAVDFLSAYYHLSEDFTRKCIYKSGIMNFDCKESIDRFWTFASKELVGDFDQSLLCKWLTGLKTFSMDHPYLTSFLAGLPLVFLAWRTFRVCFEEQSAPIKQKKSNSVRNRVKNKIVKVSVAPHSQQFSLNQTSFDLVNKIAAKSVYHLQFDGCEQKSGFITFLGDRVAVCPEHFLHAIEQIMEARSVDDLKLTLTRVGSPDAGFSVNYTDILFTSFEGEESDLVFLKFPKVCHPHADLSVHFLKGDNRSLDQVFKGGMLRTNSRGFALVTSDIFPNGAVDYSDFNLKRSFTYNIATKNGECGAPIFMFDAVDQKPYFVGIHTAGNNQRGVCNFIDSVFVKAVLSDRSLFSEPPEDFYFDRLPDSIDLEAQMGGKFVVEGKVPINKVSTKSKVQKSPLHQCWGPSDFEPPLLVSKGDLDPWAISRNKYSLIQPAFDMELLAIATEATIQDIHTNSVHGDPWKPRVLSFEEACRGVPGVPFCESIPRDTSAGYPYNIHIVAKGKRDFFGSDPEFTFHEAKCQELREKVQNNISSHALGMRTDVLYADYLKDERRKRTKVEMGKTRPISACPIDYLVECRMYFGDVVRWFMQNRIRNSVAVGVNAYSSEWSQVREHLALMGDNNIFGDYSGYDTGLCQALMYKALQVLESFYVGCPNADKVVREALFMDVVNSRHVTTLPGDKLSTVYDWYGSNPSGNFLTTILNSICNLIAMRYAVLLKIKHEVPFFNLKSELLSNFRLIVFGDDNGMSVSPKYLHLVDQQTMTEALGTVNMVYTNESKTEDSVTLHRPLSECSFLKRSFVYNSEYKTWVAPLELAVILEMPYWTKRGSPKGSVESTVDTCMMELALHGHSTYFHWAPKIAIQSGTILNHFVTVDYHYWLKIALHCEAYY